VVKKERGRQKPLIFNQKDRHGEGALKKEEKERSKVFETAREGEKGGVRRLRDPSLPRQPPPLRAKGKE